MHYGPAGLAFAMILESAGVPVPSEIILPLFGLIVLSGGMGFWPAVLMLALMQTIGSWVGYGIGYYGGRPLARSVGRFLLLEERSVDRAEQWFNRYGAAAVFFARFLPVMRTFISWPAGFARMAPVRFTVYTFVGSLPWTAALLFVGMQLGPHLGAIEPSLSHYNLLIGLVVVVVVVAFFARRVLRRRS